MSDEFYMIHLCHDLRHERIGINQLPFPLLQRLNKYIASKPPEARVPLTQAVHGAGKQ